MNKINVLIVEDEWILATELAQQLEVNGYAASHITDSAEEAKRMLSATSFDLLLIDVALRGNEDGISVAHFVKDNLDIPFIFVTSSIDRLTVEKAKETNPSAYLVKPYHKAELQIAIELALYNYSKKIKAELDRNDIPENMNGHYYLKESFFVKHNHKFVKVNQKDISFLEADNNYVQMHTENNKLVLAATLGTVFQKLNPSIFVRVHRSFVVNLTMVEAYEGNRLFIGKTTIPVGRNYRETVFSKLPSL